MRVVVVGASSGLGRCIGIGLAQRGADVALLARRKERLESAVAEGGGTARAIECDVTDPDSVTASIEQAASDLGGIDGLIYTPGIGPLKKLVDMDAATWQHVFATNVTGAAITANAVLPHLQASAGRAIFLSSVSGSMTPTWPGLGAYNVSKAALDKLVEAWRGEHPEVGFTCLIVGDCAGGDGEAMTGFADGWDMDLLMELHPVWTERKLVSGSLFDVEDLVNTVDVLLKSGPTVTVPSLTLYPRPVG